MTKQRRSQGTYNYIRKIFQRIPIIHAFPIVLIISMRKPKISAILRKKKNISVKKLVYLDEKIRKFDVSKKSERFLPSLLPISMSIPNFIELSSSSNR